MGLTVYRADGESPKPNSTLTPPPSTAPPQTGLAAAGSPSNDIERTRKPTKTLEPIAKNPPKQAGASATTRFPSAVARPLKDIVIDGRLEDWPRDTKTYPIANQLLDHTSYNQEPMTADQNPRAYFMAGYDPTAQQIYLAVVVHDDDVVVHPTDVLKTDSVEIYVDGTLSRKGDNSPSIGWEDTLDAATMPVIQYAGVPGRVAAYGDAWGANPSLVYARTREKTTKMKWRRERDVITYEWSFKAFDRFPDRATRLYPGKRLGLEVAVVDKDQATTTNKRPPTFLTWGAPPATFKGFDADSLGELILTDDKSP
jgi:hypothetical protein